ncbi:MAG TPA: PP2C family protein-serine/threonine phosphatase [Vicinamibacterales bacterium]|nr:PP2C family protein-serine/threonine phosphatase [Vicinamibacterales bacterium]
MDLSYSIDYVASTSEDAAVRRRFDQRNLVWWLIVLIVFTFVAIVEFVATQKRPSEFAIALVNVVVVGSALLVARDIWRTEKKGITRGYSRPAEWVRRRLRGTIIVYMLLQFALVLAFSRDEHDWLAWAMLFPWLLIGFRMLPAELVMMHAVAAAMAVIMLFTYPPKEPKTPMLISFAVLHSITLTIELLMSRRLRREITADWSQRRAQAREQIRMRDELRYARELQLSMLPDCAPTLGWADLCAISLPATEVGGDYYDYFVADGRVALVCGDVAGHGMASGLVLSALRSGFTLLRDSLGNPAAVLQRLHDLVAETSRRRMLVTVTVVLLERSTMRATIASAGHPPIVVRRADGRVETIELYAPPLGVRLPVAIPQRTLAMQPGDVFVLHSDGVYEARNADDEVYGLDRLAEVVASHDGTAESLRDAIVADVERFRGAAVQQDDVTVVVAKIA